MGVGNDEPPQQRQGRARRALRKEHMTTNVFHVKIHYANALSELNIAADSDAQARTNALAEDARIFKEAKEEVPKLEYCEVTFMCRVAIT